MPFISAAILFKGAWLKSQSNDLPSYASTDWDPDITFSQWMRGKVVDSTRLMLGKFCCNQDLCVPSKKIRERKVTWGRNLNVSPPLKLHSLSLTSFGLRFVLFEPGVSNQWTGFFTGIWDWNVGLD